MQRRRVAIMTPSWFGQPPVEATFFPAFEVKENKDSFLFKADLPGMKEQDIEVKLAGDRLTVSGKREAEPGAGATRRARAVVASTTRRP